MLRRRCVKSLILWGSKRRQERARYTSDLDKPNIHRKLIVIAVAFLRWQDRSKVWTASLSYNFADAMGVSLLMLLYRHREGRRRPAIYRFIAWIGLYSYGIYLWHVSVVSPIMTASQRMPHWAVVVWVSLAPAVIGILIGVVFTKLVEFPALKLRERMFPRRVDSAVGTPAELEEMVAG